MKYVVTKDENDKEDIFIFPKRFNHDDFAEAIDRVKVRNLDNPRDWQRGRLAPIAAGFTDGKTCAGRSETLDLDSRGRLDEMLIGASK
jgi:hypothetical protein